MTPYFTGSVDYKMIVNSFLRGSEMKKGLTFS